MNTSLLSPIFQTMPDPPPVNSVWEWAVVILVLTLVGAIPTIMSRLWDRKKGAPASMGAILDPLVNRIEYLEAAVTELVKKNGESEAENTRLKNHIESQDLRINTLETENESLKGRINSLETENDDLMTIVRFTSPIINKALKDTTGGLNKVALKEYHDTLKKYNII